MSFVPERRASPGALPSSCRKVENDPPTAFPRAQRGRSLRICRGTGSRGGDCLARGAFNSQPNRQSVTSLLLRSPIPSPWQVLLRQTGYSSVGRASDCRMLQQSDGPWFDSGWPDIFCAVLAQAEPSVSLLQSNASWVLVTRNYTWRLQISFCLLGPPSPLRKRGGSSGPLATCYRFADTGSQNRNRRSAFCFGAITASA